MKKIALTISVCMLLLLTQAQPPVKYSVIDPSSGITWSAWSENPTSIYRYRSASTSNRLPTIEELTALYSKLSRVVQNNPNGIVASNLSWLTESGVYPSSTMTRTEEQKTFYKGISWNNQTKQFEEVLLSGGDLVMITEVSK